MPLLASGQCIFALYMLLLGPVSSAPSTNIFERKDAMQPTKKEEVKKEQMKGSCSSGDMKKSSGSCGTDAKKSEQMSGSCSSTSGKGKSGSCS